MEQDREKTLDEAFKELDAIIEEMQGGELSLEDTFAKYKEGIALVSECSKKIEKIECDIKVITEAED